MAVIQDCYEKVIYLSDKKFFTELNNIVQKKEIE